MSVNLTGRKPWQQYLIAVLAFAAAIVVRVKFLGVLGPQVPYVTFFPAVTIAALYAGRAAGLMVTLLSAAFVSYWLDPVGQILTIEHPADSLGMAIFIVSCLLICFVVQALHRAQIRANEAEASARVAQQRRADEEKLRESEARYRLLFESSMDAIFLNCNEIPRGNRATAIAGAAAS